MTEVVTQEVGKILHQDATDDDKLARILVAGTGIAADHLPSLLGTVPAVGRMEVDGVKDYIQDGTYQAFHIIEHLGKGVTLDDMTACMMDDTLVNQLGRIMEDIAYEGCIEAFLRVDIGSEA